MDTYKLLMNPLRLRILQAVMIGGELTTSQIANELPDIAPATLYRQLKILSDANFLQVVKTNKIRGTVEKVYGIHAKTMKQEMSLVQAEQALTGSLLSLIGAFSKYLKQENADPIKEGFFMSTSTLMLSDDEMDEFTNKIGEVIKEALNNKADGERKTRRITLISSPGEQD